MRDDKINVRYYVIDIENILKWFMNPQNSYIRANKFIKLIKLNILTIKISYKSIISPINGL